MNNSCWIKKKLLYFWGR